MVFRVNLLLLLLLSSSLLLLAVLVLVISRLLLRYPFHVGSVPHLCARCKWRDYTKIRLETRKNERDLGILNLLRAKRNLL